MAVCSADSSKVRRAWHLCFSLACRAHWHVSKSCDYQSQEWHKCTRYQISINDSYPSIRKSFKIRKLHHSDRHDSGRSAGSRWFLDRDGFEVHIFLFRQCVLSRLLFQQCQRENRKKLPFKALIIQPAQRIPRYELLLRVSPIFAQTAELISGICHTEFGYQSVRTAPGCSCSDRVCTRSSSLLFCFILLLLLSSHFLTNPLSGLKQVGLIGRKISL